MVSLLLAHYHRATIGRRFFLQLPPAHGGLGGQTPYERRKQRTHARV